jgi:hypothetical protein
VCGGLEDLKGGDGEKLPTAKLFGGAAVLFVVFAAFLAFQTTTLRFTFDDSDFSLVKADLSSTGENVVVGGCCTAAQRDPQESGLIPKKCCAARVVLGQAVPTRGSTTRS